MESSASPQSPSLKIKPPRRMKLAVRIQIWLMNKYKINPYPSMNDITIMADEIDVEVIRIHVSTKYHIHIR